MRITKSRARRAGLIGAASGAVVAAVVAVALVGGDRDRLPYVPSSGVTTILDLQAARDLPGLPQRAGWCSLGRAAEHCWLMQETAGATQIADTGATGGWDLAPIGTTRIGVDVALPSDGALDGEKSIGFDGVGYLKKTGVTIDSSEISVTMISSWSGVVGNAFPGMTYIGFANGNSWSGFLQPANNFFYLRQYNPADGNTQMVQTSSAWAKQFGAHCITIVFSIESNGARIYKDGESLTFGSDLSAAVNASLTGSAQLVLGSYSSVYEGSFYRARYDSTALTLEQHQAICGTLWQPPSGGDTKLLAADTSWTQTGGSRCYQAGTGRAVCVPGGAAAATYDATGLGWPVEPSRTNRIPYSAAVNCTNWTCGGTASVAAAVAPDGSLTAAAVTMDGSHIEQAATGYGASADLHLLVWASCATGTLTLANVAAGGAGSWTVDCSAVSGWQLLSPNHAAVTVGAAWTATGAGAATLRASGADASIWLPTLTEVEGYSVIPTQAAAVDTGDAAWHIDSSQGYYVDGATVTQTLDALAGTCLSADTTDMYLTGVPGSECTGIWRSLLITR